MPIFVIVTLLASTTAVGLVFNFDFNLFSGDKNIVSLPKAQAQDTASTTVTVKNANPIISVAPAESPSSTSTTPVNVGDGISFSITATDAESNNFYLIVCSSDNVTASTTGGTPACGDTTFCTSTATVAGVQATCSYNSVADPGAEIDQWWAFACDDHATEAGCSASSQGAAPQTGDNSSPFYVNHAPIFSSASTTDNFKDPGGTFIVTASTTDSDVAGAPDQIVMEVCSTNSWATSTGCAASSWCIGTSTSPNVTCSFATTTPAPAGQFSYFVFVKDWHQMPVASSQSATYTVNNVAPEVDNVIINGGAIITPTMKGMVEYIASTTSLSVSDDNGCGDIVAATSTIYWSSATSTYDCSMDDNYCFKVTSVNCVADAGTCTSGDDATMGYTCTTSIAFHAQPTDGIGNPASATDWRGSISVRDDDGAFGVGTSTSGVELITVTAIEVTEIEIPYGSVSGGTSTGDNLATTTIINYGNSPLDSEIEGTDMDKTDLTDQIPSDEQKFDLGTVNYTVMTYALSSTTPQTIDTLINKPSSQVDVSDEIYWGINIPGGTTSGDYEGTNTFTAALDDDAW